MTGTTLSLESFSDPSLTQEQLLARLMWLRDVVGPRLERYLGYYRNPTTELAVMLPCAASTRFAVRPFRQFQELGLPARITGFRRAADGAAAATGAIDIQRKEVVIENDIGWRINTLVDFTAGRPPAVTSTARDPATRRQLSAAMEACLQAAGGAILLQQLVLHGAVSGSAWVQIQPTAELLARLANKVGQGAGAPASAGSFNGESGGQIVAGGSGAVQGAPDRDNASTGTPAVSAGSDAPEMEDFSGDTSPLEPQRWFRFRIVRASSLCPLPPGGDSGEFGAESSPAYAALLRPVPGEGAGQASAGAPGILERVRSWFVRPMTAGARGGDAEEFSFDLFGAAHWQRYERGVLVAEGQNPLGFVPFVRYENAAEAAAHSRIGPAGSEAVDVGAGEVEPLIGLQDELNTRLSDRAYRVTMTSFRMWLGRGIEDFTKRPVGPGQMWSTDNAQATIEAFGGDAGTPSEASHIEEVREALDKISGVPPVAAGVLRQKLGNLTSAVALRVTLIALLARTDRKRAGLNQTLAALLRRVLEVLDRAGVVASAPEDRGIDVNWPTALPESDLDRLTEAQAKVALGVPREVVLGELGYGEVGEAGSHKEK